MFEKKPVIKIDEKAIQIIKNASEKDIVVIRVGSENIFPTQEMLENVLEATKNITKNKGCGIIAVPFYVKFHNLKLENE